MKSNPVVEMLTEAICSKKFMTMASALGLSWYSITEFAAKNPMLAAIVVIGASAVACCYIIAQGIVDAAAKKAGP